MTAIHIISILIAFILGALIFWLGMKYEQYYRDKLWAEVDKMSAVMHEQQLPDKQDPEKEEQDPINDDDWDKNL